MALVPVRAVGATAMKLESTAGTYAAPTPASDGILTYQSPDAFDLEFRSSEIRHDTASFTHRKDIPGIALWHPTFQCAPMGSGTATTPANWSKVLRAAGMVETVGASDVTYKNPSSTAVVQETFTVVTDVDGVQVQTAGCVGQRMTLSATAAGVSTLAFTGVGKKRTTLQSYGGTSESGYVSFSAFSGGTDRAKQFLSSDLSTITPNGETGGARAAYAPIGFGFTLDWNLRVAEIISYNAGATNGLFGIILVAIEPTLELFIGMDKTATATNTLKPSQIESDIAAQNTWAIHYELGSSTAGEIVQVDMPTAQPLSYTKARQGDVMGWRIRCKVQHATNGSELVITTK